MPEPKPPRVSPCESSADAGTRATPTRVGLTGTSPPAKAGKAGRRHNRTSAARMRLECSAEGQEELARRRGVGDQDAASGIGRREHAVVEVRGIATVEHVGDVDRQLRAIQPAKRTEVVTGTQIERGVAAKALIVGVGVVAPAGELSFKRSPEAVLAHGHNTGEQLL